MTDDDLTAYLDGELDPGDAVRVEGQLAADAALRRRADGLRCAHDLLDYLPRTEPSPDFAARTLTRLDAAVPSRSYRLRVRPLIAWALAGALALATGYAARRVAARGADAAVRDSEDLAVDNRVLAQLPDLVGVDDLAFARSLASAGLFALDPPAGDRAAAADTVPLGPLVELFRSYPEARRRQLRRLAQEIDALPPREAAELRAALEGYAVWLDRLADAERGAILSAETPAARLAAVGQTYRRRWLASLPAATRDRLTAEGADEPDAVAAYAEQQRERHDAWRAARRQWPTLFGGSKQAPWPFSTPGLSAEIDAFVAEVFKVNLAVRMEPKVELPAGARLSRGEFVYLKAAQESALRESNWFVYGVALRRLAARHPYLPPPRPGVPAAVNLQTLPADVPLRLLRGGPKGFDNAARNKWPEFALEVARKLSAEGRRPPASLGPCRDGEFRDPTRDFVTGVLRPRLDAAERDRLDGLAGRWPEYPRAVIDLAADPRRDLAVPGVTLPGTPSLWEKYYDFSPRPDGDGSAP